MKRFSNIFALAIVCASALSFAACTKVDPEGSKESEISFMVANYATTKADKDATNHIELSNSFGVYCYFTPGAWASTNSEKVLYMDNQQVQKDGSQWKTVGQTYKWPRAGKLSFVGFTPYATEGQEKFKVAVTNGNLALTLTDYTVKTDGSQPDIMYSDATLDKSENDNAVHYVEGVPMLFHHALTKVNVDIKLGTVPDGTVVIVNSVKFVDVNTRGSFNSAETTKWRGASMPAEYAFNGTIPAQGLTLSTTASVLGSYLVMPQSLSTQSIEIEASLGVIVEDNNGVEHVVKAPLNTKVALRTSSVPNWNPGQEITYHITLSGTAGMITFDPVATNWTELVNEIVDI